MADKDKSSKQLPIGPGLSREGRSDNARACMARMAIYANRGELGSETLVGLQRPSQCLEPGIPAMVLRRGSDGVWCAAEWSEPDVVIDDGTD